MDLVMSAVASLGVSGAVVAAVLYYLPKAVARLQEQRDADAAWLRSELDRRRVEFTDATAAERGEFLRALRELTAANAEAIERSEERWRAVIGEITAEVRSLRDEVRAARPSPQPERVRPAKPPQPTDDTSPWEVR